MEVVNALVKSLADRALRDLKGSLVSRGSMGRKEKLVTQDLQDSVDHRGQE